MGPLLVGAAGLMWGHVVVAGSGPGGGLGASRLPPLGTSGRGRQLRRVAPAAWGDFGAVTAAAARLRLLPWGDFGLGGIEVEWFSREVNDLILTLEASTCFDRYFLRFYYTNPAVFHSKSVDASGA